MDAISERQDIYSDFQSEGVAMTLVKTTNGTYNPATGLVANTTTSYDTFGIIQLYNSFELENSLIQEDDQKLFVAIATGMPKPDNDDVIQILGVSWTVVNCKAVQPTGVAIAYKIQVRK